MRAFHPNHFAIVAGALVAGLAGCAGQSVAPPATPNAQFARVADATASKIDKKKCGPSTPLLYVASYSAPDRVLIYPQGQGDPMPCGYLAADAGINQPYGLFVDANENLWVANARGTVEEFAKDATQPTIVLTNPGGDPRAVAVDPNDGTVYVLNSINNPGVAVYPAGSTSPKSELTDAHMNSPCGPNYMSIDARGDIYVTNSGGTGCGSIIEFKKNATKAKTLKIAVDAPEGIQTMRDGALALCDVESDPPATPCGIVARGKNKIVPAFSLVGDVGQLTLAPGEATAMVAVYPVTAWALPGPDQQPLQTFDHGFGDATFGIAMSPADPPGAPF